MIGWDVPGEPVGSRASSYELNVDTPDPDPRPVYDQDEEQDDEEDYGLLTLLPCYQNAKETIDQASKVGLHALPR